MLPELGEQKLRILVTGAGGPAGVAVIRSLQHDPAVEIIAADMDIYASGLYLVDRPRRWIIPPGAADGFNTHILARCRAEDIAIVIPTVDAEMLPLSTIRHRFTDAGIRIAMTSDDALRCTLDKFALARRCSGQLAVPRTELLGDDLDARSWTYPVIVKPRSGSGSRGVRTVEDAAELHALPRGDHEIVQEYLPGQEYSLDVLADEDGRVLAVVPRARLRVDSGVSVAGRTLHDPELDAIARAVVRAVGLTLVSNVQVRLDRVGRPALLEVNPRFPGSMPLTVASGVDMPRLCLDAVCGRKLPTAVDHIDLVMVRFLEERFFDPATLPVEGKAVPA
jgi:carbamoyl-phosphate synthase large subunit